MSEARPGSSGASGVLQDVVACIMGVANAKAAITARVQSHGGRVAARLGKDVTHIVWERRHSRKPSDKAADESELLDLFHKLEKMDYPPAVVSPLWVEESIKAGRRQVERKFLVKKPTESLLGRTPGTGGGAAAKKRKRPAAAALPKPAEAYELDDFHISSTQQIQGQNDPPLGPNDAAGEADVSSPRGGGGFRAGGKQQRRGGGGGRAANSTAGLGTKQQRGGSNCRVAAERMPTVVELLGDDAEEEEGLEEGLEEDKKQSETKHQALQHQRQHKAVRIGADTQAVANILTVDLPEDDVEGQGRTPGGTGGMEEDQQGDEDELDTPLAVRVARSSAERAAGWASGGSSGGRLAGAAAVGADADKRSRLALASGPQQQAEEQAAAVKGEEEAMQMDESSPHQEDLQMGDQDQAAPAMEAPTAEQGAKQATRAVAAVKGVAERFSVRQLVQHPERPVLVHKGTPLPGSLLSLPAGDESADPNPIPVPVVERVESPWPLAEQVPTQTPASQAEEAASGAQAEASGRPSMGPPKAGGRRSLLAVSGMRRGSGGGGGTGGTPAGVPQPLAGSEGKLPSPWSTLRAWDAKAAQQQAAAAGAVDENREGPPQQQQQPHVQAEAGEHQAQVHAPGSRRQQQRGTTVTAAELEQAAAFAPGTNTSAPGPSHGCISLTSVDAAVVELARSATRRLRGLRLCPEGREEGLITHLVIGGERRTLKLMLAVANGAWLLSPQWVTASLEAGRWLPESQFPAKVRFEAAAERARSLLEVPDALPLLHDQSIYIHLPEKARKLMAANAAALKRVTTVLGAKVVQPKSCTLCLVVGGGARPPHIPKRALCVKEEWLLQAAERFELPPLEDYALE